MATQACVDLRFDGVMTAALDLCDLLDIPTNFLSDSNVTGRVRFGTTGCYPESRLWIGAPRITFTATVTARGDRNIHEWTAGFLQTITDARWGAHYSNGKSLLWRLNIIHGPLKDGRDDSSIFMRPDSPFHQSRCAWLHEVTVHASDSPAQMFFREYSGDPFNPIAPQLGTTLGRLARIEGHVCFQTYLASVNASRKSVLTLSEMHWRLTWTGNYDFGTRKWESDRIEQVVVLQQFDRSAKYENLTSESKSLPFSLFLETAEKSWEVLTEEGWIPCKKCFPTREQADKPTLAKWG